MLKRLIHKVLTLVFVVTTLSACRMAFGVLDPEEMSDVLVDIHVTEAALGKRYAYSAHDTKRAYFENVFEKHDISYEQFQRSVKWYAANPREYIQVYELTIKKLEKIRIDVEHYVYHPEDDPSLRNLIDKIDLWTRAKTFEIDSTNRELLAFEFTDSSWFAAGDEYLWQFTQRAEEDRTDSAYLALYIDFVGGRRDSIVYDMNDTVRTYQYSVRYEATDTMPPCRISGKFYFAKPDTVPQIKIRDVIFVRSFNSEKYPLDSTLRAEIDSMRLANNPELDSTQVVENQKDSTAEKTDKVENLNDKLIKMSHQRLQLMKQTMHEKNRGK